VGRLVDLTGKTFGRWVVISHAGSREKPSGQKYSVWNCLCICGKTAVCTGSNLKRGASVSCGCYRSDNPNNVIHGFSSHPLFGTYNSMVTRCTKEKSKAYPYYGGRGIRVCDRWLESFENFLEDMGERPTDSHSIDRIDNDGNYEPSNCRWATKAEQAFNQRKRVTNTSGRTGVYFSRGKWVAEIMVEGKSTYLGSFNNKDEAVKAREDIEEKFYGQIKE